MNINQDNDNRELTQDIIVSDIQTDKIKNNEVKSDNVESKKSTKEKLDKEYEKYTNIDNISETISETIKPKTGDVIVDSKITNVNGNYFRATPEVEKEILKLVKEDYYKIVNEAPEHLKKLMEEYEPWCYYEDIKGGNCFRVSNIDELEIEEGKFTLSLHCFKVGSGQVDELIGVSPKFLRKVNAWKRSQINMISQCKIPEAFIRPLGYLLLLEMSNESNLSDDANKIINKPQLAHKNE